MDFSIIVPTYNRLSNLKLVLAALDAQHEPPECEVVIADDGSIDGTRDFFKHFSKNYKFPIIYQWCGPNLGFRPHRTRNIGIAQASAKRIVILDSDVLLNPHAMHRYGLACNYFPDVVIVGMYHFAKAEATTLTPEQVADFSNVMKFVPDEVSVGPPVPGIDCRVNGFHETLNETNIITNYDGLGFFSGNISWPTELWWQLGGQDELMVSGQGEDAEFGNRMRVGKCVIPLLAQGLSVDEAVKQCIHLRSPETALPVLQYAPIYGVHVPHPRNFALSQKMVQVSIKHIDMRYGIGTYDKITDPATDPREKNLSIWYTRKMGAELVQVPGDPTVYVAAKTHNGYVGIPEPFWIELLDFTPDDIKEVSADFFADKTNFGVIKK